MHSFRVSRRTAEIGVRMALGASRTRVLAMVLKESLWVLAFGLAAGIPLALLAVRPLRAMLYQTQPLDAPVFAAVAAILLLVGATACLVPAWRASRLDPIQALRTE